MLTIALPKGRTLHLCLSLLRLIGVAVVPATNTRCLTLGTAVSGIKVVTLKMTDVQYVIQQHTADFGLAGSDVINERQLGALTHHRIGTALCWLDVASHGVPLEYNLTMATKYPKAIARFVGCDALVTLVKLDGALEAACDINLAKAIADIVDTGTTLKANGLVVLKQINPVFLCVTQKLQVKSQKRPLVHQLVVLLSYVAVYLC